MRSLIAIVIAGTIFVSSGAATGGQSGYEAAIYDAAGRYGISGDWLLSIAICESGLDHSAVGPGGERGVMQFHPNGEWPYAAWYGPYEQIELAAQLLAAGRSDAWVCAW